MNNFYDLLWKTFGAIMVFFICTAPTVDIDSTTGGNGFNINIENTANNEERAGTMVDSIQATTVIKNVADDPKIKTYFTDIKAGNTGKTVTVCPSGYYLAKCGSRTLGINWLKGMTKKITIDLNETDGTNATLSVRSKATNTAFVQTDDFYSYDSNKDTADSTNMSNLRKFFNGKENISYTQRNGTAKTVTPSDYIKRKNQILSNYCTNDVGELSDVDCQKCPNDATVGKSTVYQDTEEPNYLMWNSWQVQTIADCYLQEFQDDTGSYVYVSNNIERNKANKLNCYYNQAVEGSKLD